MFVVLIVCFALGIIAALLLMRSPHNGWVTYAKEVLPEAREGRAKRGHKSRPRGAKRDEGVHYGGVSDIYALDSSDGEAAYIGPEEIADQARALRGKLGEIRSGRRGAR